MKLQDLIKKLEKQGKIRRQKAGCVQIEGLLRAAILDLEEACAIASIGVRSTYMLAYTAMLKTGRALLLQCGYVPDDGAQHKTVVEMTAVLLGDRYKELTEHFEDMRRKRNDLTYEVEVLLTRSESKEALQSAIELVSKALEDIKAKNPQMELKFEIKKF
ncbi:MAG: hypothetical protein WC418_04110 [Candidatus Omnitrophota bacterium]|jgi:uncharacterized protein (UPF0332 family)